MKIESLFLFKMSLNPGMFSFCRNVPRGVGSFVSISLVIIFIILIQLEGFKYILHQSQQSLTSSDVRQEHFFSGQIEQQALIDVKR